MWKTTLTQSLMMLVLSLTIFEFIYFAVPLIAMTYLVTFILVLMSMSFLWFYRKQESEKIASLIFSLNILVGTLGVNFNQEIWLQSNLPFQAFFGIKFLAVFVALLAPTRQKVGWFSFAILFFAPLIQYCFWSPAQKMIIGFYEPWLTALIVSFSAFLYFQRMQLVQALNRKARLETSALELKKYSQVLLGAQHLLNTPLQVIEGTAQLIHLQHPEAASHIAQIEKAFQPIREINRLLSFGHQHIVWDQVQLPVDIQELEKQIQDILSESKASAASLPQRKFPSLTVLPRKESPARILAN